MLQLPLPHDHGETFRLSEASPAPGAGKLISLDDGYIYLLRAFSYTLAPDATVANRYQTIYMSSNWASSMFIIHPSAIPASYTNTLYGYAGLGFTTAPTVNRSMIGLPPFHYLWQSAQIVINVEQMEAADQISGIQLMLSRWPVTLT